jgi:hypothetical protein
MLHTRLGFGCMDSQCRQAAKFPFPLNGFAVLDVRVYRVMSSMRPHPGDRLTQVSQLHRPAATSVDCVYYGSVQLHEKMTTEETVDV